MTPTPQDKEQELPYALQMIIEETEPDQFIDLLCFSNFVAGNQGGHIPVENNRKAFEIWLTRHTALAVKKAEQKADRKLRLFKLKWHSHKDYQLAEVEARKDILENKYSSWHNEEILHDHNDTKCIDIDTLYEDIEDSIAELESQATLLREHKGKEQA